MDVKIAPMDVLCPRRFILSTRSADDTSVRKGSALFLRGKEQIPMLTDPFKDKLIAFDNLITQGDTAGTESHKWLKHMMEWYKELLRISKPVPEAAQAICEIWRKRLNALGVRLWLYNQDFEEFDLLACSCEHTMIPDFQRQTNQLPLRSIAGKASQTEKVCRISNVNDDPNFFCDPPADQFFNAFPALVSIPLISLEQPEASAKKALPLGVLDVHFKALNTLTFSDEELLFLGSLNANALARGHSRERRELFAALNLIALDLVVPGSEKTFEERKKIYYAHLIAIIKKFVYANGASIFTADPGFDTIRCCATTGLKDKDGKIIPQDKLKRVLYRKGDGATGTVFEKNEPKNCKNVRNLLEYRGNFQETRTIEPKTESDPFLAVPMRGQEGKIATGVIRVLERRCHVNQQTLQNFSQYDQDILMSLAAHVSPVFRLLSLHDQRQRYVASMAHQVIQPLTGVITYSDNIINGVYKDSKEIREKLSFIRGISRAVARLAQGAEWIAVAKDFNFLKNPARSERVLTQYILERISDLQPIRQSEGIVFSQLDRGALDRLGSFWCDDLYYDQAVQNVLHNAVKYSYPGTEIDVNVRKEGRNLILDVSSTGIPIEANERERIFYDCEQGKWAPFIEPNGTGQGLCICRQIMKALSGSVELLDSRPPKQFHTPPKGLPAAQTNTFRIILPEAFK